MRARRVLVVDDEAKIRRVLRGYLEAEGFTVLEAANGIEAVERAETAVPDLILLDVLMPGLDGLEVLRRLRAGGAGRPDVYVILLTARAEEVDTVVGLSVGADDYVTKPFSPRELIARIKAVLRRARAEGGDAGREDGVLRFPGLTIDPARREVHRDGREVALTALEFDLLAALAAAPGRVFSRRQLLERVWGYDFYGDERVVDVHVRNLRRGLGDDAAAPAVIGTVRGAGYKFLPRSLPTPSGSPGGSPSGSPSGSPGVRPGGPSRGVPG